MSRHELLSKCMELGVPIEGGLVNRARLTVALRPKPEPTGPVYYRCATRVSDCHRASLTRVVGRRREFYVCGACQRVCEPVGCGLRTPDPGFVPGPQTRRLAALGVVLDALTRVPSPPSYRERRAGRRL
jgi:hypothetical protein